MKINEFLFSKKYGSLYYKIYYFIKYKLPFTKHWNAYNNPLMPWWKVRKQFKRPKCHLYKGKLTWFFGFPCNTNYLNPILDIRFSSLGWKDKYDSPRHEWDPYISIVFVRKWQLLWIFNWIDKKDEYSNTRSMATWEAILCYLYYNQSIKKCIKNNTWKTCCEKDAKFITIEENLK